MKSIAFPLLGGGILGFPRDIAAKLMFENCVKYLNEKPDSNIQIIEFISTDQTTVIAIYFHCVYRDLVQDLCR
mgnify:FL=1